MKNRIPTIKEFISESFFSNLNVGEEAKTRAWLDEMKIKNYTINKDGSVDVKGDVYLHKKGLTEIPIQFNKVGGDFYCHNNKLTSLKGAPKEVLTGFWCESNNLVSLEGSPSTVGGWFDCSDNKLTSLGGGPSTVGGRFWCNNNKVQFTEEDVHKVSNVKGSVHV